MKHDAPCHVGKYVASACLLWLFLAMEEPLQFLDAMKAWV
jgi:hypothetical protein